MIYRHDLFFFFISQHYKPFVKWNNKTVVGSFFTRKEKKREEEKKCVRCITIVSSFCSSEHAVHLLMGVFSLNRCETQNEHSPMHSGMSVSLVKQKVPRKREAAFLRTTTTTETSFCFDRWKLNSVSVASQIQSTLPPCVQIWYYRRKKMK